MRLWIEWMKMVVALRPACSRERTFLWMASALMGLTVREDLLGVTSIIRALGLKGEYYDRVLDFYHSSSLCVDHLTRIWAQVVFRYCPGIIRENGMPLLVGDGIKAAKSGKKMPAVKLLHQQSESNNKAAYIMGHSCQAVGILAGIGKSLFSIPLASRIHEGLVFSNRDKRTLLDKMVLLVDSLVMSEPFHFIADAYYASAKVIYALLDRKCHLISRARSNATAYLPASLKKIRGRGRPRKYGKKVKLIPFLLENHPSQCEVDSPVYGETNIRVTITHADLLWRPVGTLARFVLVIHPSRGKILLMTTDLSLAPVDVLRLYSFRFKIEVSFKHALRVVGAYACHFWMMGMKPTKRWDGDTYLHHQSKAYRDAVLRKLGAYHRYIQLGLIAQGMLQVLAISMPCIVWSSFGSWIRTIRPDVLPSEFVTAIALKNTLPKFLSVPTEGHNLSKFILDRVDLSNSKGIRLAA